MRDRTRRINKLDDALARCGGTWRDVPGTPVRNATRFCFLGISHNSAGPRSGGGVAAAAAAEVKWNSEKNQRKFSKFAKFLPQGLEQLVISSLPFLSLFLFLLHFLARLAAAAAAALTVVAASLIRTHHAATAASAAISLFIFMTGVGGESSWRQIVGREEEEEEWTMPLQYTC